MKLLIYYQINHFFIIISPHNTLELLYNYLVITGRIIFDLEIVFQYF